MLPNSGHDIGFFCPLVEIVQTLEVCEVFLFICRLREGDGDMFSGDPLIEIVFNLDSVPFSHEEENEHITYNCKDKGNG